MIRHLPLLLLFIPGMTVAQQSGDRMLSLTTQDTNGLHIVMVLESPNFVRASVREFSPSSKGDAKFSNYSRERFDELWLKTQTLDLATYSVPSNNQDVGASKNYVITIGTSGSSGDTNSTTYLIPKCGAKPEIKSFVIALTQDLLPAGSPGLFEPCTEPANEG